MNKICSVYNWEQICIEPNLYTGSLQCEIVVIR